MRKFKVPLSRISKVCAVAFPRRDRFADREALPVTSRAAKGAVLPMPTLPPGLKIIFPVPVLLNVKVVFTGVLIVVAA